MHAESIDILMLKPMQASVVDALSAQFILHQVGARPDLGALRGGIGPRIRGIAAAAQSAVDGPLMEALPNLEIVASLGVGYETVDAVGAQARGIVVTHTPDVLTDEVADLALGLLLATIRQIPAAERHLRAGRWPQCSFPLTATLRGRTVGVLGLGRIGLAIARRLEGFGVAIAYHSRSERPDVAYSYHPTLLGMARAVDTLIVAAPGGPGTAGLVDAEVLAALGPEGIVVNIARGSVVDEGALVAALSDGTILGAGLDVFANEPQVPEALIDCERAVLLPHVGSGSVHTRAAMGQLVVDNLISWFAGKGPLTPVPETPWDGRA